MRKAIAKHIVALRDPQGRRVEVTAGKPLPDWVSAGTLDELSTLGAVTLPPAEPAGPAEPEAALQAEAPTLSPAEPAAPEADLQAEGAAVVPADEAAGSSAPAGSKRAPKAKPQA